MNSIAVGVHTPLMSLSASFVKPAPLPKNQFSFQFFMLRVKVIYIELGRRTLQCTNNYHDEICAGVQFSSMRYAIVYFFTSIIEKKKNQVTKYCDTNKNNTIQSNYHNILAHRRLDLDTSLFYKFITSTNTQVIINMIFLSS